VTFIGELVTEAAGSRGIVAQSTGATGAGGITIQQTGLLQTVATGILADSNGGAGNGGAIMVTHVGTVSTSGAGADGITATSSGAAGAASVMLMQTDNVVTAGMGSDALVAQSLSSNGTAGTVSVIVKGSIGTQADGARAIVAQSEGGTGGSGGAVIVQETGMAVVEGSSANAITAQSTGGDGTGAAIGITVNGAVSVAGAGTTGIYAQSLGGVGSGGAVTIGVTGVVMATASGATGISAQSQGTAGNGNIAITIADGGVEGGSGAGVGIALSGGAGNLVAIDDSLVETASLLAGTAITAGGGNTVVDNNAKSLVIGSINLGAGTNAFNNAETATFISGATVYLGTGAGDTLTNAGVLSPGGYGNVFTTNLTGNLVQTGTGIYPVDVDFATNTADRITASGTATLAGTVPLDLMNPLKLEPGNHTAIIISAAEGVQSSSLVLSYQPSAVVTYQLEYPNPQDVVLDYDITFAPSGLTRNEAAIGNYINGIQLAGGAPQLDPLILHLYNLPNVGDLAAALDRLNPAPYLEPVTSMVLSTQRLNDDMQSCHVTTGEYRFVREGDCGWLRTDAVILHRTADSSFDAYQENTYDAAGGLEHEIAEHWHLGGALAYDHSGFDTTGLASGQGGRVLGGAVIKGQWGGTTVSASVEGGYGSYDMQRSVDVLTPDTTAKGNFGLGSVAGHLRGAQSFEFNDWYVKPMVDVGVVNIMMGSVNEFGAGPLDANIAAHDETHFTVQPEVEVGGEFAVADGVLARPYIRVGLTEITKPSSLTGVFAGDTSGAPPFIVRNTINSPLVNVTLGADVLWINDDVLRIEGEYQANGPLTIWRGSAKFSMPF
jgi:hypothetical protein